MRSTVASQLSRVRPLTAIRAPADARASANADPIAPPPPDTRAVRPSRLNRSSWVMVLQLDRQRICPKDSRRTSAGPAVSRLARLSNTCSFNVWSVPPYDWHSSSNVGQSGGCMTLNLAGLIPATVLPMHADGSIDEGGLRAYIAWIAQQGPVALAINVDTGEGPHLTHEEKIRVLQIVRDVTDLPIVAGLAGPSTDAAVRQATEFKSVGANALLVFPIPAYLSEPLDPRVPVGYHEAIAQVGLPMILFQLQPALAGL